MIEVGDLVKFESVFPIQPKEPNRGVWLVVCAETDPKLGRFVTLKKGNHEIRAHVGCLYKISSDR